VHDKSESIGIAYLFPACNVYILSKRVLTVVLEDRRGSARNKLRESACLQWLQWLTLRSAATVCMSSADVNEKYISLSNLRNN
jgi:hypothetical protein